MIATPDSYDAQHFPDAKPCPTCGATVIQAAGSTRTDDRFPAMYRNRLGLWVCWACLQRRNTGDTEPTLWLEVRDEPDEEPDFTIHPPGPWRRRRPVGKDMPLEEARALMEDVKRGRYREDRPLIWTVHGELRGPDARIVGLCAECSQITVRVSPADGRPRHQVCEDTSGAQSTKRKETQP